MSQLNEMAPEPEPQPEPQQPEERYAVILPATETIRIVVYAPTQAGALDVALGLRAALDSRR
jgi:hypothetical protein